MSRTGRNIVMALSAVLTAAVVMGGAAVIAAETPPATRQNYSDRYGVLSERSIFLRERGGTTRPRSRRRRGPPPSPPSS
jgi:hypothetical protein